jgi:tetratricopeptide (TPR) repeat protein
MLQNLFQNKRLQILTIAGTILLLYIRTLSFDFIGLDEKSLLVDKRDFNKELSNIPKAFRQHVFQTEHYVPSPTSIKYYRPLLTVSFILDEHFSNNSFALFRFSNMLIHFMAVLGLLFVFQQLKIPQAIGFVLSLLFAVHPLLIQAVAWIPGRNDSLVCAFLLWSFYFLLKTGGIPKRTLNTFLHLLLFTAALLTKENAIVFFIICIYYLFLMNKNILLKNKLVLCGSYIAIIFIWYLMRKNAIGETFSKLPISEFYSAFLKSAPLLFQYFQKTILPVNLAVMSTVQDTNYGWVLIAFTLFGASIYFTKKIAWTEIILGLLWYFLFFLPTLIFSYFEGMEHRSYLPMAGLLIAFAYTEPVINLANNFRKLTLIFGSAILIFAAITFVRIPVFSSELAYWESAYYSSEHSAVVCRDYGIILTEKGEYQKAEQAYLEGIKRNPKEILVHYNLGVLYYKASRFDHAEEQLNQELGIDSTGNPLTYHLLGEIYKQTGRMPEAVAMWQKALKVNPGFQPAIEELNKIGNQ